MDETTEDGTTYDNGSMTYSYGSGYDNSETQGAYQADTQTQNDLYDASGQAALAGDSYGAYELNQESIQAGADANSEWQEYNGYGDYAPTMTYDAPAETAEPSYSAGSDDTMSTFEAQESAEDSSTAAFDSYISS